MAFGTLISLTVGRVPKWRMLAAPSRVLATLVLLACFLSALPAWTAELAGRVVGLTDGDTMTVLTPERRQVRVRLGGIDTPERRQPRPGQEQRPPSSFSAIRPLGGYRPPAGCLVQPGAEESE